MASQPNGKAAKDEGQRRKWTTFEETIMMNLIVRSIHRTGLEKDELSKLSDSTAPRHKHRNARRAKEVGNPDTFKYVDVGTALNRALHKSDYTEDIPVEEVKKLLHFFLRNKKGAIAVIDRQPAARLTRSIRRIWNRGLNFVGTIAEWEGGRKAAEEVKRREDEERRLNVGNAGAITHTADGSGVADGWGADTAAAPSGDGWGTAANENNADASAAVSAWGDAMEVDAPATATNNPKTIDGSSHVEAGSGAWGSGAADSSMAAISTAADPWGAAPENTNESNSAAAAWGEPETSEAVITTVSKDAMGGSVNEDPFATPLPPPLGSYINKTTTQPDAWGAIGTSSASYAPVESNPWNGTPAGQTGPISDGPANAWGNSTGNSTTGVPSTSRHGPGKTADTAAEPWGTGAESALPSLHSTADTTADPWGTSAESSVIQPTAMDWGTEVSVTPANSFATKAVEQAGPLEVPVGKSAPISFSNSWGGLVANTSYQPVTTTSGGWGDKVEQPQGHTRAPTIIKDHGEAQRSIPPAPSGWGPTSTTLDNPAVGSSNTSLWASVIEDISLPRGMNSSNDFQNPSCQGSNPEKTPNNSVQGAGINPDRLAMLTAAETGDAEASNFEAMADEPSRGRKGFKNPSAAFGSNDNAIPLKFNRLARQ
ncbi:hypothetical protein VE03_02401 [Pseudogymnoascus sp. 23342-1-I1]|nr:hypothetical protein VE03_02401 [Pseudogymnoascus sp. 23342-1-I1]